MYIGFTEPNAARLFDLKHACPDGQHWHRTPRMLLLGQEGIRDKGPFPHLRLK